MRKHGSLEKDENANQAAIEAAKGAAWGGLKVRGCVAVHLSIRGFSRYLTPLIGTAALGIWCFRSVDVIRYLCVGMSKVIHVVHFDNGRKEDRLTFEQWGAFFALAGGTAYAVSPVYRGLTVQFKTYVYHYFPSTPSRYPPPHPFARLMSQDTYKCPA
jgi:hypothetical protein